jgi:multiple sugar transport system ATP-binding protein
MADLKLVGATKSFGSVDVLHGISLDVKDGEFVVFVGPSGCGKSTLLRVIAGLETVTDGDVFIDGARVTHVPASTGAGGVPILCALPADGVRKNSVRAGEYGLKRAEIEARVDGRRGCCASANLTQAEGALRRPAPALPSAARSCATKIFLFDEPLSTSTPSCARDRKELAALHSQMVGR